MNIEMFYSLKLIEANLVVNLMIGVAHKKQRELIKNHLKIRLSIKNLLLSMHLRMWKMSVFKAMLKMVLIAS
jgi:hypothetical protein